MGAQSLLRLRTFLFTLFGLLGSPESLRSLPHANGHHAFFYAISVFDPSEPISEVDQVPFVHALCRGPEPCAIAVACA
ncbi:hypothetical protein DFH94DRAFT_149830 [Russula ochroleuca]|jgi:hypothetical protein|uniref:Secreted protein n=1 Tax=Russula ochroleuca TaxID=152965 RepID=A0A9P5K154_9AGAM|nr:hypothetical protein DFH94DRAFT_149830 [Russula ochroleuca]